MVLLNQRIPSLGCITRTRQKVKTVPSLREILQKNAEVAPWKQSKKRSVAGRVFQHTGALLVRALWFSGLLLLGWYVFDNHASPEFRVHVFEFIAFAQSKITILINRFSPGWLLSFQVRYKVVSFFGGKPLFTIRAHCCSITQSASKC